MLDFNEIEKKIGYRFHNRALLETALTHVSYARVYGGADNERLEYLGDAVLEMLITERQYFESVASEGSMTKSRQGLVSKLPLKEAVERMDVAQYLRFVGGKTQMEVANHLGISQAQVSRLEKGAIGAMRKSVSIS